MESSCHHAEGLKYMTANKGYSGNLRKAKHSFTAARRLGALHLFTVVYGLRSMRNTQMKCTIFNYSNL